MPSSNPKPDPTSRRVTSLDAYRGFVMLAMASAGLGLAAVANQAPDNVLWGVIGGQVEHVPWRGCAFWDLIQPSFLFLVGASIPFSVASRKARGNSDTQLLAHAVARSIVLVALGVFLASNGSQQTDWTFTNVLAQIGLGYTFVFLLSRLSVWGILSAALGILFVDWLAFAAYPLPPEHGFDAVSFGWTASWRPMTGFYEHWEKNINVAAAFDRWFLNQFPRPDGKSFRYNPGGYTTLNFVPSMSTMLFGVLAGQYLKREGSPRRAARTLFLAALIGLVAGSILDISVCPSVKRIWTPSWTIFSAGWAAGMLAVAILLFDAWRLKRLAFPFVVVGANSIVIYLMAQLIKPWVKGFLRTHLTTAFFTLERATGLKVAGWISPTGPIFSGTYGPILESCSILFCLWLACYWLFRSRIFVRI